MENGAIETQLMYIPKTKINKDGYITYYETFCENTYSTEVEVGTTGSVGGDSSQSFFKITIQNGAVIEFEKFKDDDGNFGIICDFRGDFELEMIQCALKFISKVLEAQEGAFRKKIWEKRNA